MVRYCPGSLHRLLVQAPEGLMSGCWVHWLCLLTRKAWSSLREHPLGCLCPNLSQLPLFYCTNNLTLYHRKSLPYLGQKKDVFKCMIIKFISDITGRGAWWKKEVWRAVSKSVFCCLTSYSSPASPLCVLVVYNWSKEPTAPSFAEDSNPASLFLHMGTLTQSNSLITIKNFKPRNNYWLLLAIFSGQIGTSPSFP